MRNPAVSQISTCSDKMRSIASHQTELLNASFSHKLKAGTLIKTIQVSLFKYFSGVKITSLLCDTKLSLRTGLNLEVGEGGS